MHSNGAFLVHYGPAFHNICKVNETSNGMDKETCRAWAAILQMAKAQGGTVRIDYESTVAGNPSSCDAIV